MKTLLLALLLTTIACGKDEAKSSDALVSEAPVTEEAPTAEDQAPAKKEEVTTYEAPSVVTNVPAVTVTLPAAVPAPVSEDPIVAQKITEMDTMIQDRVNLLLAWNVWDDYRDKLNESPIPHTSGQYETPAYYFQVGYDQRWMKENGLHTWWFEKKVYHCGELVDSADSELSIEYAGRDTTERSKLYIQVYFYTPSNNGPIYITKIKLNWKFSNGVEQESVREAKCQ